MKTPRVYQIEYNKLEVVREDITKGIAGFSLIPSGMKATKVVLTTVEPYGEFSLHQDQYHHILYFISGTGECNLGDETHPVGPGTIVEIPAGTLHGYKNRSEVPIQLLTINIQLS